MEFYSPPALQIVELVLMPPPTLNGGQGTLEFYVSEARQACQKVSFYNFQISI